MNKPALLVLEDGTVFEGVSIGADGCTVGEVVFNTALTGYQEILSDPSYARQIVTLTYPHIGNVGVNDEDIEADVIHASGLVVRDVPQRLSNFRSQQSLGDYLRQHDRPGIAGIDTRKLTRLLRTKAPSAVAWWPATVYRWTTPWPRRALSPAWPAWIWPRK